MIKRLKCPRFCSCSVLRKYFRSSKETLRFPETKSLCLEFELERLYSLRVNDLRMSRDLYYCAPSVPAWRVTETFTFAVRRITLSECVWGVLLTVQNSKGSVLLLQRGFIIWDESLVFLVCRECSLHRIMLKSKSSMFSMMCAGYFVSCETVCLKKSPTLERRKSLVTYTVYWTSVQIIYFEKQLPWADYMIVEVHGFTTRSRTILCPLGWEHVLWCAERLLLNPCYLLLCRLRVLHSLVFRLLTVTRALLCTLTTISCQLL
jgi:hypothetical protein